MKNDVVISLIPKYWKRMMSGEKRLEIRTYVPQRLKVGNKVFICLKGTGKVVGFFRLGEVFEFENIIELMSSDVCRYCGLRPLDFQRVAQKVGLKWLYCWEIDDLHIYEIPRDVTEFCPRPPQSFYYVR